MWPTPISHFESLNFRAKNSAFSKSCLEVVEHVENYAFCNKIYVFCIFDFVEWYFSQGLGAKKIKKCFHAQLLLKARHSSSSILWRRYEFEMVAVHCK